MADEESWVSFAESGFKSDDCTGITDRGICANTITTMSETPMSYCQPCWGVIREHVHESRLMEYMLGHMQELAENTSG